MLQSFIASTLRCRSLNISTSQALSEKSNLILIVECCSSWKLPLQMSKVSSSERMCLHPKKWQLELDYKWIISCLNHRTVHHSRMERKTMCQLCWTINSCNEILVWYCRLPRNRSHYKISSECWLYLLRGSQKYNFLNRKLSELSLYPKMVNIENVWDSPKFNFDELKARNF